MVYGKSGVKIGTEKLPTGLLMALSAFLRDCSLHLELLLCFLNVKSWLKYLWSFVNWNRGVVPVCDYMEVVVPWSRCLVLDYVLIDS